MGQRIGRPAMAALEESSTTPAHVYSVRGLVLMKPLVSILIPAFNAEQWIGDTLRSAMAQTWPHTEIIVVDDGSSDATVAIAKRFESRCIRVVSQNRQGGPAARNTAYSLCQGDYVQWLDNDDLLAPDKIQRQVALRQCQSKWTILSSAWGEFMYRPRCARFVSDCVVGRSVSDRVHAA
jgi:glycosyltransferase involved in cell wall biosynthesis